MGARGESGPRPLPGAEELPVIGFLTIHFLSHGIDLSQEKDTIGAPVGHAQAEFFESDYKTR